MNSFHKKLLREKSATEITAQLLSHSSLLSTSLELSPFVEEALSHVLTGKSHNNAMDRASCLSMVVQYMQLNPAGVTHKLGSIIERLPTLIEKASASLNTNEATDVQRLLQEVIRSSSAEQVVHISKILSKLITVASKIAVRDFSHSNFGLSILESLVCSKIRNLLTPNAKSIRDTCLEILMCSSSSGCSQYSSNLTASISSVYGYALSLEPAESWMKEWIRLNEECLRLLSTLGLKTGSSTGPSRTGSNDKQPNGVNGGKTVFPNDFYTTKNTSMGSTKALFVQRVFSGLCKCLKQVLLTGCSGGFIRLDLSSFMKMVSVVLGLHLDISTKDPVNMIENSDGISPFDLCLIGKQ